MASKKPLSEIKKLAAVFAHADDEAFGPAGTLSKLSSEGKGVYLICVTDGDDTTQDDRPDNLVEIRRKELQKSADSLGIKKVFFLDYKDGELKNNIYHDVADSIKEILDEIKPDTIMSFEPQGVSGHIDHIFCSMVSSYLFEKLPYVKRILYHCILRDFAKNVDDYFIYFPKGYDREEVDLVVDTENYWEKKVEAIKAHKSQIDDVDDVLSMFEGRPKEDYFLIREKE